MNITSLILTSMVALTPPIVERINMPVNTPIIDQSTIELGPPLIWTESEIEEITKNLPPIQRATWLADWRARYDHITKRNS